MSYNTFEIGGRRILENLIVLPSFSKRLVNMYFVKIITNITIFEKTQITDRLKGIIDFFFLFLFQ